MQCPTGPSTHSCKPDHAKKHKIRLHWKLFFPLVTLLWIIIGITIVYFVSHERQRQKENLENRLLNVNNTVVDAYNRGVDLSKTVDFIRLFTDKTTLEPLRITVYDREGNMIADNAAETIRLYDADGNPDPRLISLVDSAGNATIRDIPTERGLYMVSAKTSPDSAICTFAALPYRGEVIDFLSTDPAVWVVVILLGIISSVLAYLGARAVCRNIYALRDYAQAIANDDSQEEMTTPGFTNDELGEVSRNLLSVYRDKIHAEKEKIHHERQIAMSVRHELNTPVGIIKGYLDTVIDNPDMPAETRTRFLRRAQQNADRLANLISDINTVMSLDESGTPIQLHAIDIHSLASRIAEDVKQGHIADNMTLKIDIPEGLTVMAHESLLTNALLNLIYNSARHSGGNEMTLRWDGSNDGFQVFTFSDNGIGVEQQHISRLFDLFYRVESGRSRKSGGTGLGLPLVKRIITAMGGTINVASPDPSGLTFTISLKSAPQDSSKA